MVDRGADFTLAAVGALVVALVVAAFLWPIAPANLDGTFPQALLNLSIPAGTPV
jgi:hypothetical protein